jgi:hypothetical protein
MADLGDVDTDVFEQYDTEIQKLASVITVMLNSKDPYNTIDGREWCEENGVPESSFADAVEIIDGADYGVSPMYPFRQKDSEAQCYKNSSGEDE